MSTQIPPTMSSAPNPATPEVSVSRRQPRGLVTLSGTEMWERFSFYGLQVILAYYLYYSLTDGGLGLSTPVAMSIAGAYGGAVYVSQILGAWVADRLVAARTLVLYAGALIVAGHVVLAVAPGLSGLISGLGLIVLGTGGLKVNTTSMVGELYEAQDPRRDAGYSFYYMGISLGAFLGPTLTAVLQSSAGFHIAFGAAAVGMSIGLVQYIVGMKHLPSSTRVVPNPLSPSAKGRAAMIAVTGIVLVALTVVFGVLTLENLNSVLTAVIVIASIGYFWLLFTSRKVSPVERRQVHVYIPIFIASLLFWTLLFQLFTTLAVYIDTRVDLNLAGFSVPPALIITLEGVFATVFAPIFALAWTRMGSAQPHPAKKMLAGIVCLAVAFLGFAAMSGSEGPANSVVVVLAAMVLFGAAEILVVPTALSATAALAPRAATAQMTSLYFLTMAGGSSLAGLIATAYTPQTEATLFITLGVGSLVLMGLCYLAYTVLHRRTVRA